MSTWSQRIETASDTRRPCRYITVSKAWSRLLWRPTLPAAATRRSTSSGVRYSRVRVARFGCRRGGTFPFTALGALRRRRGSSTTWPIAYLPTFPIRDILRKVLLLPVTTTHRSEPLVLARPGAARQPLEEGSSTR